MLCFRFLRWIEFLQWLFQTGFFHWSGGQKKWLLVALYRWLSYAVTILWELTWAGSAMVVLDKWSFYIGGQISGFGCNYQEKSFSIHLLSKQCSLIKNGVLSALFYSVTFSQYHIAKIIQNLDPGKAHRHSNISINVFKICGPSFLKPFTTIFKKFVDITIFKKCVDICVDTRCFLI